MTDILSQSNIPFPPAPSAVVSPRSRPRFFDLLRVWLCYSGGLILGTGLAVYLWLLGPQLWSLPISNTDLDLSAYIGQVFASFSGLIFAAVLVIAAAACILGVIGPMASNRWRGRGSLFCVLLGTTVPLAGLVMGYLASLWFSAPSPPPAAWEQNPWFWLILYAMPGIGAAFLLMRPKPVRRLKEGVASAALAVACFLAFAMHNRLAASIYQHREANLQESYEQTLINYQPTLDKIAAWAKATFSGAQRELGG